MNSAGNKYDIILFYPECPSDESEKKFCVVNSSPAVGVLFCVGGQHKAPQPGGLTQQTFIFQSAEDKKSQGKVLTGLMSLSPLFLACRWPSSLCPYLYSFSSF